MNKKTIAFASDHGGYELKKSLMMELSDNGNNLYEIMDLGCNSADISVDYPDYGKKASHVISNGEADLAVIICGSGIGISIAANRISGVRAALCHNGLTARLSRQHNDANILALGARIIGIETAKDCLWQFLNTEFEAGRHQKRIEKLCC